MDSIDRLSTIFEKFPGIGPRQAARFVAFLLRSSPSVRRDLVEGILGLANSVRQCTECMRYHADEKSLCSICGNPDRDQTSLAVVAADVDLSALERSGTYRGRYFVIGGTVSLASEKASNLRLPQLKDAIRRPKLKEVILAFPANPEGDATGTFVRHEVEDSASHLMVTSLGRGLSTGSELEYADPETLKSAIDNRR